MTANEQKIPLAVTAESDLPYQLHLAGSVFHPRFPVAFPERLLVGHCSDGMISTSASSWPKRSKTQHAQPPWLRHYPGWPVNAGLPGSQCAVVFSSVEGDLYNSLNLSLCSAALCSGSRNAGIFSIDSVALRGGGSPIQAGKIVLTK